MGGRSSRRRTSIEVPGVYVRLVSRLSQGPSGLRQSGKESAPCPTGSPFRHTSTNFCPGTRSRFVTTCGPTSNVDEPCRAHVRRQSWRISARPTQEDPQSARGRSHHVCRGGSRATSIVMSRSGRPCSTLRRPIVLDSIAQRYMGADRLSLRQEGAASHYHGVAEAISSPEITLADKPPTPELLPVLVVFLYVYTHINTPRPGQSG